MNWTEKKGREKEGAVGEGLKSWQKKKRKEKKVKTCYTGVKKLLYLIEERCISCKYITNLLVEKSSVPLSISTC